MDEIDDRFGPTAIVGEGTSVPAAGQLIRDISEIYGRNAPEYAYFLTWLGEDYAEAGGRKRGDNPGADALLELLEEEDGSITPNLSDHPADVDDIRFGALFALCRLYEYRGELDEAKELLQQYADEFGNQSLFLVLQSEILTKIGGPRNLDKAIEAAITAASDESGQIEILHNLAAVITRSLEQDHVYSGDQAEIPDEREQLLQLAAETVERTIGIDSDYAKCYITKAKV